MSNKMIFLNQSEMPTKWINPLPYFDKPLDPPIDPETEQPMEAKKLKSLLPETCVDQEMSQDKEIDIPEAVLEGYQLWRPSPLCRAIHLERYLETPAKIFFKYEGVSPPGSHKPNTALAQTYYAKREGTKTLTTETGAGQWGSALSFTTSYFDLNCKVYMVRVSYNQKPYRKSMMESWNAKAVPSPSEETKAGRSFLDGDADTEGSLGMAISEAIEMAFGGEKTKYSLGSVLNHVLIHQSIVGQETKLQLEKIGLKPDVLIGCTGGGSNYGGLILPFLPEVLSGERDIRLISAEATACPTLTEGEFKYDFADSAGTTPLIKMHTLGHNFVPPGIHAGGLRYHGMAPILCRLKNLGYLDPRAFHQTRTFQDALKFSELEGYIPAPETSHAITATIEAALEAKKKNQSPTIVFNFSGHGHFDMSSYDAYLAGKLEKVDY
ncbi:MAG: TrpB-like pyridoxal phosphate-dependent enzyme [Candidatus Bipolaricaulota bacterium]